MGALCYVRDTQVFDPEGLTDEEESELDYCLPEVEKRWSDINACVFVGIVSAKSSDEAVRVIAEKEQYDPRILIAIQVCQENAE